jgi:hypothetical protein
MLFGWRTVGGSARFRFCLSSIFFERLFWSLAAPHIFNEQDLFLQHDQCSMASKASRVLIELLTMPIFVYMGWLLEEYAVYPML